MPLVRVEPDAVRFSVEREVDTEKQVLRSTEESIHATAVCGTSVPSCTRHINAGCASSSSLLSITRPISIPGFNAQGAPTPARPGVIFTSGQIQISPFATPGSSSAIRKYPIGPGIRSQRPISGIVFTAISQISISTTAGSCRDARHDAVLARHGR
jgi:hypothetical protein